MFASANTYETTKLRLRLSTEHVFVKFKKFSDPVTVLYLIYDIKQVLSRNILTVMAFSCGF